jgi:ATP-dependent exoDNAse (exonuclease V) beta subunit
MGGGSVKVQSIGAGAGTGKTTELTRIVRESIISGRCRAHAIIGTTFTKKAAGELVERVRQELFKTGKIDFAERLAESLLGTVDSICLRLLRRFAFEAGISPRIEIIAETDASVLLSGAIEDSCWLAKIEKIRQIGERLCQRTERSLNWKNQIGEIAEKARENAISPDQLEAMAAQSCNELCSFLPAPAADGAAINRELAEAISIAIGKISAIKDTTNKTADYIQLLRTCERELAENRLTWSQWLKLTKDTPAKASLAEAQRVLRAAPRYEEHPQLRSDIKQYIQLLFEFGARALRRYQERKEERGLLDFVDLERRTLALLDQPEVAKVISEEFDLLVVDEFQDTNPIQLALFIRLAKLIKHGAVWVGDVKQAIYGFRGSDPALMETVIASVRGQGAQSLNTTYRARPELVQLFNDLFIPAFQRELNLEKKEVELRPGRAANTALPMPLEFWELRSDQRNQNGTPKKLTDSQAAQALAEGIARLLANRCQIEDRNTGQLRSVELRDIAVLCRTNGGAATVADALRVRGFQITLGTSGLLSTPEVRLAMACLRRMADAGDTLATAEIIALAGDNPAENWLKDRLEYLSAHPEDREGRNWGLTSPLVNQAVVALHEAHASLDQLTPAEALDVALGAGNVFTTVSRWGPSEHQSAQRRANLETLRGLALQYERGCVSTHIPTTVAGFVFWCEELAAQDQDLKAVDERADAIHVLTYHTAKGLEWPIVISDDLDYEHRKNLWDITVVQDAAFDARKPLANRRLRFWPWPFGNHRKDIALLTRIENEAVAKEASAAADREALRLLYVGFTRARDILVLVTRGGQAGAWLELLQAPWLRPLEAGSKTIIDGVLGPTQVPCCTRVIQPPVSAEGKDAAKTYRWFPAPVIETVKLPARITPSEEPEVPSARVVRTINLGTRLPITGKVSENVLGDALHAIFAAEFINPNHPDRLVTIARILQAYDLSQNISAQDAANMLNRFTTQLKELFQPKSILVEVPFSTTNNRGQLTSGFIDLLVETDKGFVIVDHKSFLGGSADWPTKALSFSGQLAAYCGARRDLPIASAWIHFAAAGGLMQVVW